MADRGEDTSDVETPRVVESLSTEGEEEEEEEDVKISLEMMAAMNVTRPHTQIDYVHHLVPHLSDITNCSFYWGKMDRYEAESLLDEKPEGSFLLRDSAQDEYLFSVSFRRYGRGLHVPEHPGAVGPLQGPSLLHVLRTDALPSSQQEEPFLSASPQQGGHL